MKTINIPFNKYYTREYNKTQIFIHHTVSPNRLYVNDGPKGDIQHWNNQSFNIGTYCIIDADGVVYKLFDHTKWSNHLGLKKSTYNDLSIPYRKLDHTSVGIELDNFGPLILTPQGFKPHAYPDSSWIIPEERVIVYDKPFRGHKYYEAYTPQQITSLQVLLLKLTDFHDIPKHYNEDMWDLSVEALSGVSGIWTHTSVRKDKQDVHPQTNLIAMLKDLKPKTPNPPIPLPFTEKDKHIKELQNTLSQFGWGQNINK